MEAGSKLDRALAASTKLRKRVAELEQEVAGLKTQNACLEAQTAIRWSRLLLVDSTAVHQDQNAVHEQEALLSAITVGASGACSSIETVMSADELVDCVLVGHGLTAQDLSRLECVSKHFWLRRAVQTPIMTGSRVTVRGLTSPAGQKLNGQCGIIATFSEAKARFAVTIRTADGLITNWITRPNLVQLEQSIAESAAQLGLLQCTNGWRVTPREDECWKQALAVFQICVPTPTIVAAGSDHTLFIEQIEYDDGFAPRLIAFGSDTLGQLGIDGSSYRSGSTDAKKIQEAATVKNPMFQSIHFMGGDMEVLLSKDCTSCLLQPGSAAAQPSPVLASYTRGAKLMVAALDTVEIRHTQYLPYHVYCIAQRA